MSGKEVAVIGEVTPIPAKDPTGTWVPDLIIYEAYDHLTIGGQPVIYRASCNFIFTPNPNMTGKPAETVILSAGASVLQGGQTRVLVNNDSATGTVATNELRVKTSNKLRSA
jgi:hypothetical protein